MPTFPAKINYAAGNVLTAAQMVDIGNGLNDLLPDAKGSLTTVSAANTPAQLTVGNNGETLVADSSTSTGLRYNPQNVLANPVINGGMDIWQRGTSFTVPNASYPSYTADRWQPYRGATGATVSRQNVSDSTNLPNIQYAARIQRDSGNTSTAVIYFNQSFESVNSIPFAGKTITFSFYARAGANFSAASSQITTIVQSGTGTDQNVMGSVTGGSQFIAQTPTLTTTWQRFAYTGTVASTATQLFVDFRFTPVGTAGANDWYEITGVQIDLGTYTASSAPTFRRAGGTVEGELQAAQRYYQRISQADQFRFMTGVFIATSTTNLQGCFPLQNTLRTTPTSIDVANVGFSPDNITSGITGGTFSYSGNSAGGSVVILNYNCTGATQYRPYIAYSSAANAFLGVSAEL